MIDPSKPGNWGREELISLLSVSATLAGLSITAVTLLTTFGTTTKTGSVVDDILVMCAAAFLLCTYLFFWALRARKPALSLVLTKVADTIFLAALGTMTVAAFLMVYTIW